MSPLKHCRSHLDNKLHLLDLNIGELRLNNMDNCIQLLNIPLRYNVMDYSGLELNMQFLSFNHWYRQVRVDHTDT